MVHSPQQSLKLNLIQKIEFYFEGIFVFVILLLHYHRNYSKFNNTNKSFIKKIKLKKRFITGSYLGYNISRFVLKNDKKSSDFRTHLYNGITYGHWGITIIIIDNIQDSFICEKSVAREFVTKCLDTMFNDIINESNEVIDNKTDSTNLLIKISLSFCEMLNKRINHYKIINVKDSFKQKAEQFLEGQLYSSEQKIFSEEKDFNWYYDEVINQKTLNFFLAPISLFCHSDKSLKNLFQLENTFLALNQCYFHWMLIDDVADIKKDINESIITAPGFILLSQGKIAEIFMANKSQNNHDLIKILEGNRLLLGYFTDYINYQNKGENLSEKYHLLRYALSNDKDDFKKNLEDLIIERKVLKDSFIKAFFEKDFSTIQTVIDQSKTCNRILWGCFNTNKIDHLERCLLKENFKLKLSMGLLNKLMDRTYLKAKKQTLYE